MVCGVGVLGTGEGKRGWGVEAGKGGVGKGWDRGWGGKWEGKWGGWRW